MHADLTLAKTVKQALETLGYAVFMVDDSSSLGAGDRQAQLEQVLKARDDAGNETSINKNCADMDRQVPMLMGVSRAILENVIFCHQDEALWPFSDQANLKKIFDEIFDTTKHTKVLEELRKEAKKYGKQGKEKQVQLALLKKDYEIYAKLKSEKERCAVKRTELVKVME